MKPQVRPVVLLIMDGWGYREESESNAILHANKPVFDRLWNEYPSTLISGSGLDVGLPDGQMGNSEVGHVNLGAGRVVYQDFTRITKDIAEGTFDQNPTILEAIDKAVAKGKAVHLMGLLSPGGVHSHDEHIHAAIRLAAKRGAKDIYLHAFLDGRDTPPKSAHGPINAASAVFEEVGTGKIASIVGRYFAMDRDKRWDRVQKAYDLIARGTGEYTATSPIAALENAYAREEVDEFVKPTTIHQDDEAPVRINDGDALLFLNYRADRARELTYAFTDPLFEGFARGDQPKLSSFVCLTEYASDIEALAAYPPEDLPNTLGEYLQNNGLKQLRIAETEKYAHVTFFFSGGRETEFDGETRILVPSPDVATYDMQPEMSAPEVTDKLVAAIESGEFDTIICNYANADMVGHTGKFDAAKQAIEALDTCIGRVVEAAQKVGGEVLITADHGNAEQMEDPNSGQAHTAHTCELVPFIYVGRDAEPATSGGVLSDVAPTILYLMGMEQPSEMTGKTIMTLKG
ncbi:MAG: phosphoglycerate mutase (2,3-diphosphoglycerate-independent) [Kangiellaceae bacterium]|nr:phosphoglycerate mutase (2,3-diphosphoglycerate-independent) [Kangiellaceae bacterium]|tara:strand:+ start:9481 stop:11031 length:1551 start_codon:yes stop_codon:yes gene_type:complete